jgi:hypothetical protein
LAILVSIAWNRCAFECRHSNLAFGQTTVHADSTARFYIRPSHVLLARCPMARPELRPSLSGKQSDETPDNGLFANVRSELFYLESKPLILVSFDVRFGSGGDLARQGP